jgi:signal peptidase I
MGYFDPIPERKFILDDILKWIVDIVAFVALGIFFIIYMCDTAKMIGNSMAPCLNNGESVLINKVSYALSEPKRYDVIVFKDEEDKLTIKRIIGHPGEQIKIEDSKIYIKDSDGETVLDDKYCKDKFEAGYVTEYVKIPMGEYFVLGDSRNVSEDSRFLYVGNIKEENIIGKAWMIYSPFNRIGFID